MASLSDLCRDLDRALDANKEENAVAVRRSIAERFPDTTEGAEAMYKLGLHSLYRAQDLDAAATHFRAAAKAKKVPWSLSARTSLGLVMLTQGKHQQAVFELRRAASVAPPTIHVAQACGMLVLALTEIGNTQEAERTRTKHLAMLDQLTKDKDPVTAALARFTRGMEHKFEGQRDAAKSMLATALEGEALPADERAVAEKAVAGL